MGAVDDSIQMNARRNYGVHFRQGGLDIVDRVDDVGARLLEDEQVHGPLLAVQRAERHVLRTVDGLANVAHANRRAVAIRNDDVVVRGGFGQLIVVDDGEALLSAQHGAFGRVHRRADQRRAHVLHRQPAGRQLGRIDLHADGRPLLSADGHQGHAGNLRDLRRDHVLGKIVDLGQRQGAGISRHDQDRRVGGVHFLIGRRRGQILREKRAGGRDCCLHVARGAVDVAIEVELQRNDRRAERAY